MSNPPYKPIDRHDIARCGDPLFLSWYPMRVTYSRELSIKQYLDDLNIENFIPMRYGMVPNDNGKMRRKLIPAVNNLIFIHSTRQILTNLKMTRREFLPLRYMISRPHDSERGTVMVVPDNQMNNFIRVASIQDERVIFPEQSTFLGKEGHQVRVTDGDFKGVTGVIKRVKGSKRVVVELKGIAAVAIAFIPGAFLQIIDGGENNL